MYKWIPEKGMVVIVKENKYKSDIGPCNLKGTIAISAISRKVWWIKSLQYVLIAIATEHGIEQSI